MLYKLYKHYINAMDEEDNIHVDLNLLGLLAELCLSLDPIELSTLQRNAQSKSKLAADLLGKGVRRLLSFILLC